MTKFSHITMVGLVLCACGSDGPSFGPAADPTPAQQTAIMSTSQQLSTLAMADTQGAAAGAAAISFALGAQALIDSSATARALPDQTTARASRSLITALREPPRLDCAVVTANSIVWNHCSEQDGTTMDGMISWSAGHVDIDLQATTTAGDVHGAFSMAGAMTVSSSAIQSDMTVTLSYSGNGFNFNEKIQTQIDIQIASGCISSGTITVTATGTGTGARNAAVQVVWSGCNTFRVRRG